MMKKTLVLTGVFSFLFASICSFFLILNVNYVFTRLLYQLVLVFMILGFSISVVCLYKLLVMVRHRLVMKRKRGEIVRDWYRYHQLLNPPDMNN